jgi:tight adherence protein B
MSSVDLMRWMVCICAFAAAMMMVWVVRGVYINWKASFTQAAKVSLEDMFVFIDPKSVFHLNVGVFIVLPVVVYVVTGVAGFALIAALLGAALPRVTWAIMRSRRRNRLTVQLPDGMNMMAGSLRAGASLQMALNLVVTEAPAPLSQEFSLLLREQRLGLALEDSLRGMQQRLEMEEIDLFVSALTIAKEVGGNLSEILERLAATLRQKATMEGKIRALTSQGKLQGLIVGALPLFLAGALYVMDPQAMTPLFTTPYGWGVMAGIAVLLALGGFFIKKIVTIDV